MKIWFVILAAAAMWLSTRLPFEKTDVAQLSPVNLILVEMTDGAVCISSDRGDIGVGDTLDEALEDMEQTCSGKIFLDTVDYVLLEGEAKINCEELKEYFRPGTFLCSARGEIEPESAAGYLRGRKLTCTLGRQGSSLGMLPVLEAVDGRYYYHGETG